VPRNRLDMTPLKALAVKTSAERKMTDAELLKLVNKDRREDVRRRYKTIGKSSQRMYARAAAGKLSPRAAIKLHCLDCVSFVREDVKNCQCFACPLWAYRPFHKFRDA